MFLTCGLGYLHDLGDLHDNGLETMATLGNQVDLANFGLCDLGYM